MLRFALRGFRLQHLAHLHSHVCAQGLLCAQCVLFQLIARTGMLQGAHPRPLRLTQPVSWALDLNQLG